MTEMNLSTKQKQIDRPREQTCDWEEGGEEREGGIGSLGLADTNQYIQDEYKTRSYPIARGTIFNIL